MKNHCYWNGRITTLDKVKIDPYDLGFLRGYGVFDVMCTQNGKPFLLEEHWKRLQNSAKTLSLHVPISGKKYAEIISKLLRLNKFPKANMRTVLSGGMSSNGFSYEPGKETFLILIENFKPLPGAVYSKGAKVATLEYRRDFPQAKVTNYVEAISHQTIKKKTGALEIIFVNKGKMFEASTSNAFIVKNRKIITPKDGILLGMTRKLILKLAKRNRFKTEEREVSEREFRSADEVFLTATNKDIVPVVKVDGKKIGNGIPGPVTKELMEVFRKFTENY
jgi:branched-subunit amino acid aminotransferase/4-amino-4-deoxychorismate lyase